MTNMQSLHQSQSISLNNRTDSLYSRAYLSDAICLNNQAVSLLQRGCFKDAIATFSSSFKVSKQALQQPSCEEEVDQQPGNGLGIFVCQGPLLYPPTVDNNGIGAAKFVFRQPIAISQCSYFPSHRTRLSVTSAIVFNLALSLHLCALDTRNSGDSSRRNHLLENASILYEQAYSLQQKHRAGDLGTRSLILSMPVLNNLGLVHRYLRNSVRARYYFAQLTSLLVVLHCHSYDRDGYCAYIEFFFQTTSNSSIAAAAAA
jgi:tetratricopeptide (TPR) repeat protein